MADKQNPIACEPCRQKKCKCDRILPVCSQCSDPTRCVYPESGKRGLPQGYINHLESRLAATERALYSSYAYLRTISPRSFTVVRSSQPISSRTAAINEWSRLPLSTPEELELWYSEKARVFLVAEGDVQVQWSPETVVGTMRRERDLPASTSSVNSLNQGQIQVRPTERPREGLAERLAELEPGVYF